MNEDITLLNAIEAVDEYLAEAYAEGQLIEERTRNRAAKAEKLKWKKAFQKERTKANKEKRNAAEKLVKATSALSSEDRDMLPPPKREPFAKKESFVSNSTKDRLKKLIADSGSKDSAADGNHGLAKQSAGDLEEGLKKVVSKKGLGANVAGTVAGTGGAVAMHKLAGIKDTAVKELSKELDKETAKRKPDEEKVAELKSQIEKAKRAKTASRLSSVLFGAAAAYNAASGIAKALPVKESVDDLRLRVYEAAEAGLIDDAEKSTMLEYLNLDNYE